MTRQILSVDSVTAQSLVAHASRRGKTLGAVIDEILGAVVKIYGEGGSADDLFPAWKALRMSKGLHGAPLLPRSLIDAMVERLYAADRAWIEALWFEGGQQLGQRIRGFYPAIDEVPPAVARIHPLFAERRIEVSRGPPTRGHRGTILVHVAADVTPALTACLERLVAGLLSAYSFRVVGSSVSDGTIKIVAGYEGRRSVPRVAQEGAVDDSNAGGPP